MQPLPILSALYGEQALHVAGATMQPHFTFQELQSANTLKGPILPTLTLVSPPNLFECGNECFDTRSYTAIDSASSIPAVDLTVTDPPLPSFMWPQDDQIAMMTRSPGYMVNNTPWMWD